MLDENKTNTIYTSFRVAFTSVSLNKKPYSDSNKKSPKKTAIKTRTKPGIKKR